MTRFVDPKGVRGGNKKGSSYMKGRSQKKLRQQARQGGKKNSRKKRKARRQ